MCQKYCDSLFKSGLTFVHLNSLTDFIFQNRFLLNAPSLPSAFDACWVTLWAAAFLQTSVHLFFRQSGCLKRAWCSKHQYDNIFRFSEHFLLCRVYSFFFIIARQRSDSHIPSGTVRETLFKEKISNKSLQFTWRPVMFTSTDLSILFWAC